MGYFWAWGPVQLTTQVRGSQARASGGRDPRNLVTESGVPVRGGAGIPSLSLVPEDRPTSPVSYRKEVGKENG